MRGRIVTPPGPKARRVSRPGGYQKPPLSEEVTNIKELGSSSIPAVKSNVHCLPIIGQIEGHMVMDPKTKTTKYEHIIPQLVAVEQNPDIKGIVFILNTMGGDVEAGLAIAEIIASLSKPTVSLVLGGGHSIGVPIAVATDYSFITETATMTVHPIRLTGLVLGVPQAYEYLDKMQERVVRFVARHSKITEERFRSLMLKTGELANDIGTVLVGRDAVNVDLIDEVGGLAQAVAKVKELANSEYKRNQLSYQVPGEFASHQSSGKQEYSESRSH